MLVTIRRCDRNRFLSCRSIGGRRPERESQQAVFHPVKLLIVMDKSASMATRDEGWASNRWVGLRSSIRRALDPLRPVISVGLELFPQQDLSVSDADPPEYPYFVPFGIGSYQIGQLKVRNVPVSPITTISGVGFFLRHPYIFVEVPRGLGANA